MIAFAIGFIACAVLYTFFPALAAKPSAWLRAAWAKVHKPKVAAPVVTVPGSAPAPDVTKSQG